MKKILFLLLIFTYVALPQGQKSVWTPRQVDSLAQYVDKTTAQTITGQKTYENTVVFNDTNYTFMKLNGLTGYGDWWWHTRNFWVNTANRPDQVMRFGYNVGSGGGVVNSNEPGMSIEMESFYDGNGYDAQEFHIAFLSPSSVPYRVITSNHRIATNEIDLTFNANTYTLGTPALGTYWQQTTPYYDYWQIPHVTRFEDNNYAPFQQLNNANTAYLYYPYFDFTNKYNLGSANTIKAGSGLDNIMFDSVNVSLTNGYKVRFMKADTTYTNALFYDTDKLRLNSFPTEPIHFGGSGVYYEDAYGNLSNLVTPVLPFDTTGVDVGKQWVDPNTGYVRMVLGANLISNGDFDDWTNWSADDWTMSTPDTTNFYYENDGGKLHFISTNANIAQVYQGTSAISETYGYSFNVSQIVDTFNIYIAGNTFQLTQIGNYSGTVLADHINLFSIGSDPYGVGACEITIDNIRVWDVNGTKATLSKIISVPDTTGATDGTTVKYLGGAVVWSSDISTGGSGVFVPDMTTLDTTALGVARVLPAKVTKWDSVTVLQANKQPLETTLTDIADGTIAENLVNTANPWADNEVANNLTIDDAGIASTIARDSEVDALLLAFSDTLAISWGMMDTVLTGDVSGWKVPNNITITEIASYTNTGTVTFNIEERVETTPNTAGVDLIGSDLVADNNQEKTSTFSNATIDRDDWLVPTVTSISGDPTIFSITIRYIKTN